MEGLGTWGAADFHDLSVRDQSAFVLACLEHWRNVPASDKPDYPRTAHEECACACRQHASVSLLPNGGRALKLHAALTQQVSNGLSWGMYSDSFPGPWEWWERVGQKRPLAPDARCDMVGLGIPRISECVDVVHLASARPRLGSPLWPALSLPDGHRPAAARIAGWSGRSDATIDELAGEIEGSSH